MSHGILDRGTASEYVLARRLARRPPRLRVDELRVDEGFITILVL